jgi:hypothetical protein
MSPDPHFPGLTYYANYNCGVDTTAGLLAVGDGQCGAWAKFFMDSLKSNGITKSDNYAWLGKLNQTQGFIVKNWSFTGSGNSGSSSYPFFGIPDSNFVDTNFYNWKWTEVQDANGIAGQNNANPASWFNNHQLIMIDGKYYDPSYGKTYENAADFQAKAIDGFWRFTNQTVNEVDIGVDLNSNGNQTDTLVVQVIQFKITPFLLALDEVLTTF